jgi:hypothetical protein
MLELPYDTNFDLQNPTKGRCGYSPEERGSYQLRLSPPQLRPGRALVGGLEEGHCAAAVENGTIPIEANARVTTIPTLNVVPLTFASSPDCESGRPGT